MRRHRIHFLTLASVPLVLFSCVQPRTTGGGDWDDDEDWQSPRIEPETETPRRSDVFPKGDVGAATGSEEWIGSSPRISDVFPKGDAEGTLAGGPARSDVFPSLSSFEVNAGRLAADVAWLAADAREGRRAGTAGEQAAGDWLAARCQALGLEPAGTSGTYFQALAVPLAARVGPGSRLQYELNSLQLSVDGDLVPLFCSASGDCQGELIYVGYGLELPEAGWDDFADRDLTGKVALIARGKPELLGKDGQLVSFGSRATLFHKTMTARAKGAVGVLFAQPPGEPPLAFDASHSAEVALPVLSIGAELAESIAPGFGAFQEWTNRRAKQGYAPLPRMSAAPMLPREATQVKVSARVERGLGQARNVLARIPGGKGPTVVLGAHYDHLGLGGEGSLAPKRTGEIHNGADDNASGVAVVLEAARVLALGQRPAGDVLIALWSGEELGLLGSEVFVRTPTIDFSKIGLNLNLDMVGRAGDGHLEVLGAGSSASFGDWLAELGPHCGLQLQVSQSGQGVGGSDHLNFLKRFIPSLHLFSGVHSQYHTPEDDTALFEAEGAAKVAQLVLELVHRAQAQEALPFVQVASLEPSQTRERSWGKTWFGSVPVYSFDGPGVKISGTSAGSPAEKAGLLEGDVIRAVGDVPVDTMADFVYALGTYKPGDVVMTSLERGAETVRVRVNLATRAIE